MKQCIKGIELPELTRILQKDGYEPYRARQICRWLYKRTPPRTFEEMTDISKDFRTYLAEHFYLDVLRVENSLASSDRTQKILFRLEDELFIESVLMPDNKKGDIMTLCISSQVGCPLQCSFCRTATMGFIRNLTATEILDQVLIARRDFLPSETILRNLVFMGMGEPLLNTKEVIKALTFQVSPQYCEISPRRVTISTVGIVPGLKTLAESNLEVNIALSLNATTNEQRTRLMPINKKYPIEAIMDALRSFPLPRRRRITIEYVMLRDINDSDADAARLAQLLRQLRCKINLITYNPVPEIPYAPSPPDQMQRFREVLLEKNYTVAIRYSKGRDIQAACGQLAAKYERT